MSKLTDEINFAVEQIKKDKKNIEKISDFHKDIVSFALAYETLLNQLKEDDTITNKIKCEGKMVWLKTALAKKYPYFSEEINNYGLKN